MGCTNQNINKINFRNDFSELMAICETVHDIQICLNSLFGNTTQNTSLNAFLQSQLTLGYNTLDSITSTIDAACDVLKKPGEAANKINDTCQALVDQFDQIFGGLLDSGGIPNIENYFKLLIDKQKTYIEDILNTKVRQLNMGSVTALLCGSLDAGYNCYINFLNSIPQNCMSESQRSILLALQASSPSEICNSVIDSINGAGSRSINLDILGTLNTLVTDSQTLNKFISQSGILPTSLFPQAVSTTALFQVTDSASACQKVAAAAQSYVGPSVQFWSAFGCAIWDLYRFYSNLDFDELYTNFQDCMPKIDEDTSICEMIGKLAKLQDLVKGKPFPFMSNVQKFCDIADLIIKTYGKGGYQNIHNNTEDILLYDRNFKSSSCIDFSNTFAHKVNKNEINAVIEFFDLPDNCVNKEAMLKNLAALLPKDGKITQAIIINLNQSLFNSTQCLSLEDFGPYIDLLVTNIHALPVKTKKEKC